MANVDSARRASSRLAATREALELALARECKSPLAAECNRILINELRIEERELEVRAKELGAYVL